MLHIIHETFRIYWGGDFILDSEMNMILVSLNKAIKLDRNLFIKVRIDPMYDNIRPQVNILLEEILQQAKTNVEREVSNIELAIGKMKKWFAKDYASSDDIQKYKLICNKISDAKDKLKTQSYFSYDDALGIMLEANEILEKIQESIKSSLKLYENDYSQHSKILNDDDNLIKNFKQRMKQEFSKRIFLAYGLLFIILLSNDLFYWISFYFICLLSQNYLFNAILASHKSERDDHNGNIGANIGFSLFLFVILGIISLLFGNIIIYIYSSIWPLIPNQYYKTKISTVEYRQKKTKESINDLEKKLATAKEAILLQSPKKADLTDMMNLLVKSESSNPRDQRKALEEVSQQTDVLLNSFKGALENSKKK